MIIFSVISLLGGLAMFLYGMKMMGNGLQESASGPLKAALEKLTGTYLRAFLLGLVITAVIQSSKATIVITAGLVGSGIISLRQSAGIIVGANVGTTITGQIIRLMDLNGSGMAILQLFNPSTLAPLALVIGVVMMMAGNKKENHKTEEILIGFGILFSGLITMTDSVSALTESEIVASLLAGLGSNLWLAALIGAGLALVLQSASASVGVMQAFSASGLLHFSSISMMLLGIYFGDSITTGIVCSLGTKTPAKRVGLVNFLFNLCKIALILAGIWILHATGVLAGIWNQSLTSGGIADANTIYNLIPAILLLPLLQVFERMADRILPEKEKEPSKTDELLDSLNPAFFSTPALAFGSCYNAIMEMNALDVRSINLALDMVSNYDEESAERIFRYEKRVDRIADRVTDYLVELSAHISAPNHVEILNHYYTVVGELERLSDHAMNIREIATVMHEDNIQLSATAMNELSILRLILDSILDYEFRTLEKRDVEAAKHIEPLEQVMDDVIVILKDNYMTRLSTGVCSIQSGTEFINLLSEIERLSDISSNIGVATIARVNPEIKHEVHKYIHQLHAGKDEDFNREYAEEKKKYFQMLDFTTPAE